MTMLTNVGLIVLSIRGAYHSTGNHVYASSKWRTCRSRPYCMC